MTATRPGVALPHWARWSVNLIEENDGPPLCLSLCNTKHWRNSASPRETLNAYVDLVKWAQAKRILTDEQARQIESEAAAHPNVARAELRRAIALREAIAGVFAARTHDRDEAADDLALILASFNEAAAHLKLSLARTRLVPFMPPHVATLEIPRWQAAFSAIGMLTSESIARVKQCADERGCGWLFLDTTRNASRQFCFSSECGNRARQTRFRARQGARS